MNPATLRSSSSIQGDLFMLSHINGTVTIVRVVFCKALLVQRRLFSCLKVAAIYLAECYFNTDAFTYSLLNNSHDTVYLIFHTPIVYNYVQEFSFIIENNPGTSINCKVGL